jgi:hypothetical protein
VLLLLLSLVVAAVCYVALLLKNALLLFPSETGSFPGYRHNFGPVLTKCTSPGLILVNHDRHMWKHDCLAVNDMAVTIYNTFGIKSSVIVAQSCRRQMDRFGKHCLSLFNQIHCIKILEKDDRVAQAVAQLKAGRNVFLFVVNAREQKFGGTGAYVIARLTNAVTRMYAIQYDKAARVVSLITVQSPDIRAYDRRPRSYIREIARRFAAVTAVSYDVGFEKKF